MAGIVTKGLFACGVAFAALAVPAHAQAETCPGHPDALGTSRTLVVDPREHPRIGTMQYAETLPLADKEVVLTFDDGPLPHNSYQVLDILASQCVKATFFVIGKMAKTFPEGVRKMRDAGHTIGTHSQNHPLSFNHMSAEQAKQEIDEGIASTTAALGDPAALAPFFRIPGLLRAEIPEEYLASKNIQTWSADFPADDWRHISSSRVYELAMQRLKAKGKGILLLHDIQARTVAALPRILHDLKANGFKIVHVVPATPALPATPTEPQQWRMHPEAEAVASAQWPATGTFTFADASPLPSPFISQSIWRRSGPTLLPESGGKYSAATKKTAAWPSPDLPAIEARNASAFAFAAPSSGLFEQREIARVRIARRAAPTNAVSAARRAQHTPHHPHTRTAVSKPRAKAPALVMAKNAHAQAAIPRPN